MDVTFETRNSRYVVRLGICVAVFGLKDLAPIPGHAAIGTTLIGGLRSLARDQYRRLSITPNPTIGDRLLFANDIVTTRVTAIVVQDERPN